MQNMAESLTMKWAPRIVHNFELFIKTTANVVDQTVLLCETYIVLAHARELTNLYNQVIIDTLSYFR